MVIHFSPTDFASKLLKQNAHAQEDNNTRILDDMRTIMRDQNRDTSSIKNSSAAQVDALGRMGIAFGKQATQATYTALGVFFLGLALVIYGLRMTIKAPPKIAKLFTILVWALTIPVCALVGLYQFGLLSGNPITIYKADEPFLLLSFLMYIPIGIVLFILIGHGRLTRAQSSSVPTTQDTNDPLEEIERLFALKEKGAITEEEFQKLKASSLAKS
ncbi:MAG TPA: SHOCT domain-containing protein [Nitrososphaera sp.]